MSSCASHVATVLGPAQECQAMLLPAPSPLPQQSVRPSPRALLHASRPTVPCSPCRPMLGGGRGQGRNGQQAGANKRAIAAPAAPPAGTLIG